MVFLIKEEMHRSNVQLLKESEKQITTRGLFISALSHVKLIAEIRIDTCQKHMKSMGIFFKVFREFSRKIYKKYSTGKEEWIESQTGAFHKLTCRQNKCTPKKRTILLFFFTSRRYRYFS